MRRPVTAARRASLALVAALGVGVGAAQAQPDPGDGDDRPWAVGVSPERRATALDRFRRGNQAFGVNAYTDAIAEYRAALEDWPHPAIEGNLAVALIHVDRVVEAYEHLEKAFAFGAAPFEPEVWAQLQTLHKLLLGQIARLELTGTLDQVTAQLDGVTLPGAGAHTVRAGLHELVARRPGYLTYTQRVDAIPNQTTTIQIALVPLDLAGKLERRWEPWRPWAVVGAGAAVAAVGVGLELAAQSNVDAYEREVARACPSGCPPADLPDAVRDLEGRARWQDRVAVPTIAAGALTLVAGGVMVWLNQPRRERVDESGRRVSLVPVIAPGGAAVVGRVSF